jgi:putative DNA primase/helicase
MNAEPSTLIKPLLIEHVPEQLTERPQWVCWRLEERDGKRTKVPYTPGTLHRASSTDLMTWRTFEEALVAYERAEPPYDGIGFVFSSADPYVAIDLDDCRDPESGELSPWAKKIVDRFEPTSYIEVSATGTGVHIITSAKLGEAVKSPFVEIYSQARYFTISGVTL